MKSNKVSRVIILIQFIASVAIGLGLFFVDERMRELDFHSDLALNQSIEYSVHANFHSELVDLGLEPTSNLDFILRLPEFQAMNRDKMFANEHLPSEEELIEIYNTFPSIQERNSMIITHKQEIIAEKQKLWSAIKYFLIVTLIFLNSILIVKEHDLVRVFRKGRWKLFS